MRKYQKETIAGIFVLIGLICTSYLSLKIGNISIFTDNSYSVYAHFKSVSGLKTNNRVELHGIQIGSVSGYFVDQEKQLAVVELKINEGINLYDDAVASIQTDGLLGDRYVRIKTEASGKLLKSGGIIETAESSFQELTESFKDLPDDVMEASNAFKVAIIRHKADEWNEIEKDDMIGLLDALKQLASIAAE